MSLHDQVGRKLTILRHACARVKTSRDATRQPEVTSSTVGGDDVEVGVLELCNSCLATMLGPCVFCVSGLLAAYTAGPAAALSALIAASAVLFTGWSECSSLSSRSWRQLESSVYELMYRQCCELGAVLAGSLLALRHAAFTALMCRAVGQNIDLLAGGSVSNWTASHVGGLALMDSRLDPVSGAVAVCVSVLTLLAVLYSLVIRHQLYARAASNGHVLVCLLFTAVVALFHLHFNNWESTTQFFTHGFRPVLTAASSFYFAVDVCHEMTHSLVTSCHVVRRYVMTSSVVTVSILVVAAAIVTSLTTLTSPEVPGNWSSGAPLAESFHLAGVDWMTYCACAFAIISLLPVAILNLRRTHNALTNMIRDGLLMTSPVGVSRGVVVIGGGQSAGAESPGWRLAVLVVTCIGAVTCNMTSLIGLVSVSALCLDVLTVLYCVETRYRPCRSTQRTRRRTRVRPGPVAADARYGTTTSAALRTGAGGPTNGANTCREPASSVTSSVYSATAGAGDDDDELLSCESPPPRASPGVRRHSSRSTSSSSDTDIDDAVDEYEQSCAVAAAQQRADEQLLDPRCPTPDTHRHAMTSLAVYVAALLLLCLVAAHSASLTHPATVSCLVVAAALALASCAYLLYLPSCDVIAVTSRSRGVRGGRGVALVSLSVNTCLLAFSSSTVYIITIITLSLGVLCYLLYGVQHSNEGKLLHDVPDEQRILLPVSNVTSLTPPTATASLPSIHC